MNFKRGQRTQQENQAVLKIQNVNERSAATFYHGKRVAYIYKAKNTKRGTNYKAMWGKVIGHHGNSGLVRAKFARNLPPRAMGATLRVMLYPNRTL